MLFKKVSILKNGQQLKKFECAACDLSNQVLSFYGIKDKTGVCRDDLTFRHVGNSFIEIDREKRECIVIPEIPDLQFLITW